MAARCGISRFQNGSCSGKDTSRAIGRNFLFGFQPMLNVATAELSPFEAERFAADESDGFGFDLADMHGGLFAVYHLFGRGMLENYVCKFVECGFVWECGERAYSDFVSGRKALNVPVQLVKWRARDIQCAERRVEIKAGCRWNVSVFSLGLREYKPIRTKPEDVACLSLFRLVLDAIGLCGSFERHGHAEGDSFFPFADLPFTFEPPAIGVEWSGLQVASGALFESEQRIAEAVVVERGVGFEHSARLFDRIPQ